MNNFSFIIKPINQHKLIVFLFFISISIPNSSAQKIEITTPEEFLTMYSSSNYKRVALNKSKSSDAYMFMSLRNTVAAFNIILDKEYNRDVIEEYKLIVDNIINTAQVSKEIQNNRYRFKDTYMGWITLKENSSSHIEVPLYESYIFLRITHFLYQLKNMGWVEESKENQAWWNKTLSFVEENVWNKWVSRSFKKYNSYRYLLRSRTHMGSHWAGIAMYLNNITSNLKIKEETKKIVEQYDLLLKRNLKISGETYIWNSTYDDVEGTDAYKDTTKRMQDVSHANHVVLYIISAYEFGNPNWSLLDVQRLGNTFKYIIYNEKEDAFADNVNGTSSKSRPGWGNFIADGWVKLASYDKDIYTILTRFKNNDILKKYDQELMYRANLLKSSEN